jgi:hypothetical protein
MAWCLERRGGDTSSWGPIPMYLTRQRLPWLSQGSGNGWRCPYTSINFGTCWKDGFKMNTHCTRRTTSSVNYYLSQWSAICHHSTGSSAQIKWRVTPNKYHFNTSETNLSFHFNKYHFKYSMCVCNIWYQAKNWINKVATSYLQLYHIYRTSFSLNNYIWGKCHVSPFCWFGSIDKIMYHSK